MKLGSIRWQRTQGSGMARKACASFGANPIVLTAALGECHRPEHFKGFGADRPLVDEHLQVSALHAGCQCRSGLLVCQRRVAAACN